ncbi:6-phosphogluconolactonase [Leucobacter iarius]|uniref:6-phosphogluconolactonase n=1 Tax=Leucobacter iarius TaxID=333963 RepID=A0ABN2LMX7_9MICO
MSAGLRVESAPDAAALTERIVERLIGVLRRAQEDGRIPVLVLTGGSMGKASLAGIAAHRDRGLVDWRRVRVLWGDERWLPAGDAERNDQLADDLLFGSVDFDPALVHRVAAADAGLSLDDAAAAYAELIAELDRIDLALNGVGPDGHLCSLFPGRDDLLRDDDAQPLAIAVRESPKPPPERVSLSFRALDRVERLWLLAAGAEKAPAIARVRSADDPEPLPAGRARGTVETVLWADEAALGRN